MRKRIRLSWIALAWLLSLMLSVFGGGDLQAKDSKASKKSKLEHNKGKILFVVTSHDELGETGKKTGAYISEITHPYEVFNNAGYSVVFASPKGGKTPLDGHDSLDDLSRKYLADKSFMKKLNRAKKLKKVKAGDFAGVYFAGGHGTMFDLPQNPHVQRITAAIYEKGGLVGAVCHGPVALVNVKLSNGKYLVEGKKVAAFTNEEEAAVKLVEAMPFLLETKLIERGGKFSKAPNWKKHVVVSDRLVTGQNPASAHGVSERMVSLMSDKQG